MAFAVRLDVEFFLLFLVVVVVELEYSLR